MCTPRVGLLASLNAGEAWIQSRYAIEGFELFAMRIMLPEHIERPESFMAPGR